MIEYTFDRPLGTNMFQWELSKYCEKSCHYCTSHDYRYSIKSGRYEVYYPQEALDLHDHLAYILPKTISKGHIMLFGGEPTLHPKGIQYFNDLCLETRDNDEVGIHLVTHGDISYEKIHAINAQGKNNHVVSVSYHHYQVWKHFDEWFAKVRELNKHLRVCVFAIVPPREAVWEQFEKNCKIMMESEVHIELKAQYDITTPELLPHMESLEHFKHLYNEGVRRRPKWVDDDLPHNMFISDGKETVPIKEMQVAPNFPLIPGKTFCKIRHFMIIDDIINPTCGEGNKFRVTTDTTVEELQAFLRKVPIVCQKTSCTENRNPPESIKILGFDFDSPEIKDFIQQARDLVDDKDNG